MLCEGIVKMQAGYRPSRWLRDKVRAKYQGTCQRCGSSERTEVAHIVSWPEGPTEEANLTLLCKPCNGRDRRGWGELPRPCGYDFPQTRAEFDVIAEALLERVFPPLPQEEAPPTLPGRA